jgi:hypothetical protein
MRRLFIVCALLISYAGAQTCQNYGVVNGSTCACPVGFGGQDCSEPACGGTLFQGSSRKTAAGSSSASLANTTASGCACQDGWTGQGCNVCQSANACSLGYTSVSGTNINSVSGQTTGENTTMTCNSGAVVYASGQMSCQVNVSLMIHHHCHQELIQNSDPCSDKHLHGPLSTQYHAYGQSRSISNT